jgi:hypothetical protein
VLSTLKARRFDENGIIKWITDLNRRDEGKITVLDSMLVAHGALTSDKNYFILAGFAYSTKDAETIVRVQKLNMLTGSKVKENTWGAGSVVPVSGIYVAADDSGGAVVAWAWKRKIYAQWINAEGTPLFSSPLEITSEAEVGDNNDNPMVVYLHTGTIEGAVVIWDAPGGKILGRGFGKDGTLSSASSMMILDGNLDSSTSKKDIVRRANGEILMAFDIGAPAVLRISPGFSFIGALYAQPGTGMPHVALSDDNNLLFSFYSSKEACLYVYKGLIDSIMGYKVITTPECWRVTTNNYSFPLYTLTSDGKGGAVLVFTDIRKLTTFEVAVLASKLGTGQFDREFASLDLGISAQRLNSSGSREWGDDGVVLLDRPFAQCFPDAVASTAKTAIFSAIDASESASKEGFGWAFEGRTFVQKVGPKSEVSVQSAVNNFGVSQGGVFSSSTKPELSVSIGNYDKAASIRIYVNNELKFEKTGGITSVNNFNLELLEAGSYDIKVVVTDINGNESVITFTLNSPGANAVGLVGGMVASPTPFTVATANATIAYVLANDTNTRLVIASPTGGLVMNRTFAAGTPGGMASYNAVTWDGKLPTGERAGVGIYPVKLFDANSGKLLGKTYIVVK